MREQSERRKEGSSSLLIVAWVCALAPLAIGTGVFVSWLLTEAEWLMLAGLITIYAGVASVAVAAICVGVFAWRQPGNASGNRRRSILHAAGVAAAILLNFAAAGVYMVLALAIESRYDVTITNQGAETLHNVRIIGGGVDVAVDDINPGDTVSRSFWIDDDGELVMHATNGDTPVETVIDGYVTGNMGAELQVTIAANGSITARNRESED